MNTKGPNSHFQAHQKDLILKFWLLKFYFGEFYKALLRSNI